MTTRLDSIDKAIILSLNPRPICGKNRALCDPAMLKLVLQL